MEQLRLIQNRIPIFVRATECFSYGVDTPEDLAKVEKNFTKGDMSMRALLALEDGTYFEGYSFTGEGESGGEVIFNTGMTGYQEILTDPSYKHQLVCMTYTIWVTME